MTGVRGEYRGARVTVMGLGAFGGGEGAARYLAEQGASVIVTDLRPEGELADAVARLRGLPISFHLGGHEQRDFTDVDAVVVNPAVKPTSPFLAAARRAAVRLDTAINILLRHCPATVVGVTGSNGKSTATAMLDDMLRAAGRRTWLGGNVGGSLLPDLGRMQPEDVVVLELSSFQLDRLPWGGRAPHVGVVLNVTPNHLDWHESFGAYAVAKQNLIALQDRDAFAVLNVDDPVVGAWPQAPGVTFAVSASRAGPCGARWSGTRVILRRRGRRDEVRLDSLNAPGPHNRLNAACAAGAAWLLGAEAAPIEQALAGFQSLPHRLEPVASVHGVVYVEDSGSTTPESAMAGLRSLDAPVHLIAGGVSKGASFAELGRVIAERAKTAALIGQTASEIEAAVRACGHIRVSVVRAETLAEAFDAARQAARPGDVVLLSPGCASFDLFRSYVDRAEQFRALVEQAAVSPPRPPSSASGRAGRASEGGGPARPADPSGV